MRLHPLLRLDLRRLILLLSISAALLTLANTFYASYRVQQDLLIKQTLEANRVYAAKLAESTENFLAEAHRQLAYSASLVSEQMADPLKLLREADRLRLQSDHFNSVVIVDAGAKVLATSPQTLQLVGSHLDSPGALQALRERRPLISAPYVSSVGNLLVFISQPILDAAGNYLGYIGGTIYLRKRNILNTLLGEHYYRDGSYLYVVDREGQLLYHPDPSRVGERVTGNLVIARVTDGQTGSASVVNSRGIDMLAGYAPVPSAGWGVVAQRPREVTLEELNELTLRVLGHAIPFSVLSLLAIWLLARLISLPLRQLARTARQMDVQTASEQIRNVRAWYFETAEIKRALLAGLAQINVKIGRLNQASITDPLTGLYNRRGLQMTLERWQAAEHHFAVIALDIDHFKKINDTYGHAVGDQQLEHLAGLMRENSRSDDVLCRIGGEEFVILLPEVDLPTATQVAERLRQRMEASIMPPCGRMTLSLGVAHWPDSAAAIDTVLATADRALYAAKHHGRNRVVVAGEESYGSAPLL